MLIVFINDETAAMFVACHAGIKQIAHTIKTVIKAGIIILNKEFVTGLRGPPVTGSGGTLPRAGTMINRNLIIPKEKRAFLLVKDGIQYLFKAIAAAIKADYIAQYQELLFKLKR